MTPDEWFSCKRKVAYNRESSAKDAVVQMHERPHVTNKTLEAYHCDYCDKWHIGHAKTGNLKQLRLPLE